MRTPGEVRRLSILEILLNSKEAVSGSELSKRLGVSRQVIVNDIALLRASHPDLIATNSGYLMIKAASTCRIFKVKHTDEQTEDELNIMVELGGTVLDVYVEHKVYGTISAPLNIKCRRDIENFMEDLKSGVSTPLKNITKGYHYHTVEARSEEILDEIQNKLQERGYLIESVDFKSVYQAKNYSQM
ncbi:MAG: transcription repressor NadR [Treponema sp.]|nr:transcription repressor NadR [Treponema sp.]